ncbi:MAG: hypothetical protein PHP69_04360 [Candidatus Omnitrophica bacterium]|nr:hypothetical protein [Candidatus Omnitrophota bacterium]MDD5441174.1 hypothetical protein [Candidatus Omnitrophota bacterium]
MKKEKANKLKWQKTGLTRVQLNPEQAVLSCCEQIERLFADVTTGNFQCVLWGEPCGETLESISS